jgi:hypothetical protein
MRSRILLFAAIAVACSLPQLQATTVVPISVEELTARAQVVVEGHALEQWSQWDGAEHLIYTYTRFAVTSRLKGAAADTVVVRQMGGSAGGYTQIVSGVRQWQIGDQAVLFLRPSVANDGSLAVVGLMQGNFRISRDRSGVATVSNGMPSVSFASGGQISAFSGSRMSLTELEQRVRRALP